MEVSMEDPSRTVFIGNLPWVCNNDQLFEFLSQAGTVLSAEVQRYEDTNRSKGWGLAQYINHESAVRAVKLLDRMEFNGRQVHMRLDRTTADCDDEGHNVYVGNLAWSVTDRDLVAIFADFSPMSCHVLTNMYGRSRGFAIVKFLDEISATKAINAMNQVELGGRKLECRFDRGPAKLEETEGKTAIFVSKLGPSISDDADLLALFRHIGPIVSSRVQRGAKGRPKGWGVIRFQSPTDAKTAIDTMNGFKIAGSNLPLEIRFDRK